jgi:hypothetical protein
MDMDMDMDLIYCSLDAAWDAAMSACRTVDQESAAREKIARAFRAHSGSPPGKQKQKHGQVVSDPIRLLIAVATHH